MRIEHADFFGWFSAFFSIVFIFQINVLNNQWRPNGASRRCFLSTGSSGWGLTAQPWGLTRHYRGQVAVAASGREVPLELVPGGAQGELLELLRHLLPFLGPLVEPEWVQQAADVVSLHFLHGNSLKCQEDSKSALYQLNTRTFQLTCCLSLNCCK